MQINSLGCVNFNGLFNKTNKAVNKRMSQIAGINAPDVKLPPCKPSSIKIGDKTVYSMEQARQVAERLKKNR